MDRPKLYNFRFLTEFIQWIFYLYKICDFSICVTCIIGFDARLINSHTSSLTFYNLTKFDSIVPILKCGLWERDYVGAQTFSFN